MKTGIYTSWENHVTGGCALNHGSEKGPCAWKGLCARMWDVTCSVAVTVRDSAPPLRPSPRRPKRKTHEKQVRKEKHWDGENRLLKNLKKFHKTLRKWLDSTSTSNPLIPTQISGSSAFWGNTASPLMTKDLDWTVPWVSLAPTDLDTLTGHHRVYLVHALAWTYSGRGYCSGSECWIDVDMKKWCMTWRYGLWKWKWT